MASKTMLLFLLLFSLFQYSLLQNSTTPHWNYQREGPDTWHHINDACEGEAQSPIDIRKSRVKYNPNFHPLVLNGYTINSSLYSWNFTHNGHTIVAYPPPLANLSISGADLSEIFYLIQFHFHWGYNAYQGSEHTIDGIKYPLEIHFVHQARYSGAFAVLGILFNLQRDDNSYINELLSILNQTSNTSIFVERRINLSRLFPIASSPRFYRYNGSFTTPPCTEGVTWIILERLVPISSYQLEVFIGNSIPFNFRPPQKLHSRTVLANFRPEDSQDESIHHSSACNQQISKILVSFIFILFYY
jgi:carbonic anhydrase